MADERANRDSWLESTDGEWPWDDGAGDDWMDEEPECDAEWGLPLGAENFLTGEPLVIADYFDIAPSLRTATREKLLDLEGAVPDEGSQTARILIFDGRASAERLDVRRLTAIATLHGATLRVETAREATADLVCDAMRNLLGPGVRHRRRTRENPFAV